MLSQEKEITAWMAGQTAESAIDFNAASADVEMEEQAEPEEEKPIMVGISDKVKSADVKTLMDMGFSKPVSEKSLFMTANKGVEKAMDWIN